MLCMENCTEFLELLFACSTGRLCAVPVNAGLHVRQMSHRPGSRSRWVTALPNLAEGLARLEHSVETLTPIISTRGEYAALFGA